MSEGKDWKDFFNMIKDYVKDGKRGFFEVYDISREGCLSCMFRDIQDIFAYHSQAIIKMKIDRNEGLAEEAYHVSYKYLSHSYYNVEDADDNAEG